MDSRSDATPDPSSASSEVHVTVTVNIPQGQKGFAEDKDIARELRLTKVLPALEAGDNVVLDFAQVKFATQSYVHALIGQALKQHGEAVLDRMEFKNCSPQLRSIVDLVVDYSLGGFATANNNSAS